MSIVSIHQLISKTPCISELMVLALEYIHVLRLPWFALEIISCGPLRVSKIQGKKLEGKRRFSFLWDAPNAGAHSFLPLQIHIYPNPDVNAPELTVHQVSN